MLDWRYEGEEDEEDSGKGSAKHDEKSYMSDGGGEEKLQSRRCKVT